MFSPDPLGCTFYDKFAEFDNILEKSPGVYEYQRRFTAKGLLNLEQVYGIVTVDDIYAALDSGEYPIMNNIMDCHRWETLVG